VRKNLVFVAMMCAFGSAHAGKQWAVEKKIDEMTDKVSCHLNSPTSSIDWSFQDDELYVISEKPLKGPKIGILEVRVDKNPAITLALRFVQWPYLAAVENQGGSLDTLKSQLPAGNVIKYRSLGLNGVVEGSVPLKGFTAGWSKFEACKGS